jgi:hypothetical protein
MSILDLFRFTPPGHKKYGLFLSNYLKEEEHILKCFVEINASGSVDGLKLNYDLFAKHFRAIQIQMLITSMLMQVKIGEHDVFYNTTIEEVKKFDKDIWDLFTIKYNDAYLLHGGVRGMVEELNKKPFKHKLNENIKTNLTRGFDLIQVQFHEVIKNFI